MKQLLFISLVVITLPFVSTGCYKTTVQTGLTPSGVQRSASGHHLIYGLTSSEINAPCGSAGVASITHKIGIIDFLIASITLGIYTPSSVEIECASSK